MSRSKKEPISKTLKWEVFERDGYRCRYCGAKGVPMALDHVFPESRGGPTIRENLVTACEPCNRAKRDRLGFYPLPIDYLDKLNQAQAIIDWYRDYQLQMMEQEVERKAAETHTKMLARFERVERTFKRRKVAMLFARQLPNIGVALLVLGCALFIVVMVSLTNGNPPPFPGWLFLPPSVAAVLISWRWYKIFELIDRLFAIDLDALNEPVVEKE